MTPFFYCPGPQELADLKAQLLHLQDRGRHIRINADMRDVKLRAELARLEVDHDFEHCSPL